MPALYSPNKTRPLKPLSMVRTRLGQAFWLCGYPCGVAYRTLSGNDRKKQRNYPEWTYAQEIYHLTASGERPIIKFEQRLDYDSWLVVSI